LIAGDQCTLRAAIQEANVLPGPDIINFSIATGVQTIKSASPLPAITDPVTIDGTTQPSSFPNIRCVNEDVVLGGPKHLCTTEGPW
jgi:hypothetical protein